MHNPFYKKTKEKNMQAIAILGAGNLGLAMCAHLALEGYSIRLWNRTRSNIRKLQETRSIHCTGAVNGTAELQLVTDNMEEALEGVKLILITTPADSHREIAQIMAPYFTDSKTVVLNPGRTFGVIEVEHILSKYNVPLMPLVSETQTVVYTCRKTADDAVVIISLKEQVLISTRHNSDSKNLLEQLPSCLGKQLVVADNILQTSLGNIGAILHCVPTLLNTGWIENNKVDFKYYYDGITPTIAGYLERLDRERQEIGSCFNIELESIADWMRRSYRIKGKNLFECLQNNIYYQTIEAPSSLRHRYLFEDIPCGLVPFEALGTLAGIKMTFIPEVIDMATHLLDYDFRANGRTLERLGFENPTVKKILEEMIPEHSVS
jgi:opine dehydrogenase